MEELNCKKRVRDDSAESDLDSPIVKRLKDDLLDFLDESDSLPLNQDLASVIKSFEEEITAASSDKESPVNLKSDSAEPQPGLAYLFEASDDDLGLPPPTATTSASEELRSEVIELLRVESDSSGLGDLWGFGDHIPNYDSFELAFGDNYGSNDASYDGLFEDSDAYYDSSDFSGLLWRPETLSAE